MSDFATDVNKMYSIQLSGADTPTKTKVAFWVLNSEFHVVACYRYGQFARQLRERRPLAGLVAIATHRLWNRWTTHIDHTEIDHHSEIGPGLLVMHRHGVMIRARIGNNCVIHHNVTIGQRVASGDQRVPTLGDNVWIGPGAIITGPITIGDRATISAGAVVTRDVPAGSLVAGNPARVIASDYDNSAMVNFTLPS